MDSSNGPELQVKYSVTGEENVKKANAEVIDSTKRVDAQVKQSGSSFEKYRDILGKVSAFAGGAFVTAALAAGTAVYAANEQVVALDKSLRVSSGSMQNYERNQRALQEVADKYHKSIFTVAEGFNMLTRETRDTINEGLRTKQMFDDLTVVSGKIGYTVNDTTDKFGGFIDKMKEGNVDSTNLADELDKRLYEAFVKVAEGMGATTGELNELLKESDEAVATVLPQLTAELKNALGDIPQQDAKDLGGSFEYARSKLTLLLDGLFQTSGGKSAIAQAAEDAGGYLDVLNKIVREHGVAAAGGAMISKGVVGLAGAVTGLPLELDPFGYGAEQTTRAQREALGKSKSYGNGMPIGWSQSGNPNGLMPSQFAQKEFNIAAGLAENRVKAEEKANKKIIDAAKKAAAERKRELDAITRQEIQDSNDRIREGLRAAEEGVRKHYADRPSSNISGQFKTNTGYDRKFNDSGLTKSHSEFSNPVSMGKAPNFDHIIASINLINDAWGRNFVMVNNATKAINDLAIATQKMDDQYRGAISTISEGGTVNAFAALAEGLGDIAAGTGSIEEVGAKVASAMGTMIQQIGEATIAYGVTKSGLEKALAASFGTPGAGVAAILIGAAAIAAGAALKAAATKSQNQAMNRMWDGGIPDSVGTDRIPTLLSPTEIVLPQREQAQLYGLIKQTNTGSINSPAVGVGAYNSSKMEVSFKGELLGSTIHLSNKRAAMEANYYF
ncbi:hypothetical protein LZD49_26330 [Dyadobacter sp. CY261]|uniref:hypothetical protein n=1 Tax=Dyadobacter sp. CY261 TaxID=2907203 RepID=UPI001F1A4B95|nr:hypothetical protein [Dyadobacter sp. CY261]MCF0074027.1 hypothetical protein [Dyadobacter sp. CY261]